MEQAFQWNDASNPHATGVFSTSPACGTLLPLHEARLLHDSCHKP